MLPKAKETNHRLSASQISYEVDRSLTHAIGLVDSISYVASRSKKSSKLGLKMALHAGQYERSIIIQMSIECIHDKVTFCTLIGWLKQSTYFQSKTSRPFTGLFFVYFEPFRKSAMNCEYHQHTTRFVRGFKLAFLSALDHESPALTTGAMLPA